MNTFLLVFALICLFVIARLVIWAVAINRVSCALQRALSVAYTSASLDRIDLALASWKAVDDYALFVDLTRWTPRAWYRETYNILERK